jgi:nucleoside-diphosphate-sugar epimerase
MKQCILVLGANGFIGGEVVTGLASSGWATPILGVRRPSARSDQFEQRIVEATGVDSVAAAMRDVTGVVNCVAGDAQTIAAGAKALFEAAARVTPAPRIMHLSTMSVYGSADGLIDEAATLRGDLGPYSEAKVAAEATASAYPHAVIFRPGCVFGPGSEQWTIRIARLLLAHRLGDLGAAGDGFCNLVHVGDVVAAILRALNEPGADGRAFNLSIPQPPTWNEFLVKYAIALDAVPVRRISQRRLRIEEKLLAPPLKIAEILGRIAKLDARRLPPLIPPSLIRSMRQEIRLDPGRAQAELGLHWKGLEWMLDEGARWFLGSEYAHSHRLHTGN